MSKHSRGPWYVGETEAFYWVHDGVRTIAKVVNKQAYDADLIAAAPDLYAMANMVLAWWSDAQYMSAAACGGGDGDYCEEYNVFDREPDFVIAARAVIAKVKGENNA